MCCWPDNIAMTTSPTADTLSDDDKRSLVAMAQLPSSTKNSRLLRPLAIAVQKHRLIISTHLIYCKCHMLSHYFDCRSSLVFCREAGSWLPYSPLFPVFCLSL